MKPAILELRSLAAGYGRRTVLADITLRVEAGEWLSLLGPNGSGKSTLLRCVAGQVVPMRGTVEVGGHSIVEAPEKAKRLLGFAHPPEQLPGLLTGHQCLQVYAAAHGLAEFGERTLALAERLRFAPFWNLPVDGYSLGTRQKLSLLLALIGNPFLIVLDEALNGLDPASALIVKNELRERIEQDSCSVILATHALDTVLRYSTRAALLLDGMLVQSWDRRALDSMRTQPAVFESVLSDAARDAFGRDGNVLVDRRR